MKKTVEIGSVGLAIAGMFILAMGNPIVGALCVLPLFVLSQK
jgi:uncharacterized membrane protein